MQAVGRFFQLRQRGSTLWAEMRGGAVTFLVMSYVLPVNSGVVSSTGG